VLARDGLVALMTIALWWGVQGTLTGDRWGSPVPEAYTLAGTFCAAVLGLRRTAPSAGFLVGSVVYPSLYIEVVGEQMPLLSQLHLAPVVVSGYAAAVSGRLRLRWTLLVSVCGASMLVLFAAVRNLGSTVSGGSPGILLEALDLSGFVSAVVLTVAACLLGHASLRQRRTAVALAARNAELDRLRVLQAEQVVAAERTRIARELHDVVAHHITAVVIRAQAAERVGDRDPQAAREAVRWIARTGQESLVAMRQVVRVLRSPEPFGPSALRPPGGGLGEVDRILDRVRAAGLEVGLRLDPELGSGAERLPPRVESSIVRIVQESLTNALLHARATRAEVEVKLSGPCVLLVVSDNGKNGGPPVGRIEDLPAPPPGGRAGHGLVGMRERVVSCSGRIVLDAGPLGGWRITVRFPLPVERQGQFGTSSDQDSSTGTTIEDGMP
jgi:signal transduction histidine kinase